jgi:hypothetical protein
MTATGCAECARVEKWITSIRLRNGPTHGRYFSAFQVPVGITIWSDKTFASLFRTQHNIPFLHPISAKFRMATIFRYRGTIRKDLSTAIYWDFSGFLSAFFDGLFLRTICLLPEEKRESAGLLRRKYDVPDAILVWLQIGVINHYFTDPICAYF